MKKFLVLMVILCVMVCSTAAAFAPKGVEVVGYDGNIDYMGEMLIAAQNGSAYAMQVGSIYEQQRNLKITSIGSDYKTTDFFNTYVNPQDVVKAINDYINPVTYSEDDLILLAKIIYSEAGSDWLSDEWKMCVGNIVLNRVASPEFPNTLSEVVYQPGQYYGANSNHFKNLVPSDRCIDIAKRLLLGERILEPSVVFQANFKQGSGTAKALYDEYLGWTYFCYSSRPELYVS